jgi:hypothetical protein
MQEKDLLAKAESDSTSVLPCTEKWNENPVHQGSRNAASIISYFNIDLTAARSRETR